MGRIGIYGGSFNPPHSGHVLAAKELIELLQLDKLYIIPAATPPHKQLAEGTPPADFRFELCKSAFCDLPEAEVSDIELMRSGVSYTVDTVKALHERHPEDELFLAMGSDMILAFENWYQPDEIVKHVILAVMHRYENNSTVDQAVNTVIDRLREKLQAKIICVENSPIETSSTEVRTLIAFDCLHGLLPEKVAETLKQQTYYLHEPGRFTNLSFDELVKASLSFHKPQRVAHVLGCCETAQKLAKQYGADETDAARAGILHDVTKALGEHAQRLLCKRYEIALTQSEYENSKLLHAKTGAAVAKHIFGENETVCDAIYWHTTGKADMTLLEKIIYLADYMEPNRDFDGVETLRALAWDDLDGACLEGFRQSLELLKRRGKVIDPNSQSAWEYLAKERKLLT